MIQHSTVQFSELDTDDCVSFPSLSPEKRKDKRDTTNKRRIEAGRQVYFTRYTTLSAHYSHVYLAPQLSRAVVVVYFQKKNPIHEIKLYDHLLAISPVRVSPISAGEKNTF
jgi:hypothetical protein